MTTLGGLLGWLFSRSASASGLLPQQAGIHLRQERMHLLSRSLPLNIIVGLIVGLIFGLSYGLDIEQYGYELGDWLHGGFIYGTVIGLSSFLLSWLLPSRSYEHTTTSQGNKTAQKLRKPIHFIQTVHGQRTLLVIATLGVSYWLIDGLGIGLNVWLSIGDGLGQGLFAGLILGLTSVLTSLVLEAYAKGISLTERLRWTWNSLIGSLFISSHVKTACLAASIIGVANGLGMGLFGVGLGDLGAGMSTWPFDGLVTTLSVGLFTALSYGLLYWLLLGLFQGVSSEQIENRARHAPNEGTRRSLHNSVLMALIGGGIIGVIGGLSTWLLNGLILRLTLETHYSRTCFQEKEGKRGEYPLVFRLLHV